MKSKYLLHSVTFIRIFLICAFIYLYIIYKYMGLSLSFSNIFQFISAIAPLMLGFFLLMLSIFNQDIKALIYLGGVLMASIINIFLLNLIKSPISPDASLTCNLFDIPYISQYNNPAPSSLFIAFTIAYLLLPMTQNGQINYVVLMFLCTLLGVDMITKIKNKCFNKSAGILGSVVGLLLGTLWYSLLHGSGYDSLLYFGALNSNNVVCSKPQKQTFKCSVYKNGQLISSNVA